MISRKEVDDLATLARLKLSDEEAVALQKDISSILDYVGQVSAASEGDSFALEGIALKNVMRDDEPYADDSPLYGKRDALLHALPRREGDYVVVRKIIQKDE